MTEAILIAVSDGFGGYGDFLFALKLSEQLREYYELAGIEVPPVYIVTQQSGKEKIQRLKGDVEFDVPVLTPEELEEQVEKKEIQVGHVFEGPVFQTDLIDRIDRALAKVEQPVSLTMLPEYSFNDPRQRSTIAWQKSYRERNLEQIRYSNTVFSGFLADREERGILLSKDLTQPCAPEIMVAKLDDRIRVPLLCHQDIQTYQENHDLAFQYSHDEYHTDRADTAASHFLNVYCEFVGISDKNQDVVMVGKSIQSKRKALNDIQERLLAGGFTRIIFYNSDTGAEEIVHELVGHEDEKTFRVIYASGIPHESMIALSALSGPLSGATGDQSLSECLSANKLMVYECLPHKQSLIANYDAAIIKESSHDPKVIELLQLLRKARSHSDYQRLGELLRNQGLQDKFIRLNQAVMKKYDFISKVIQGGLGWEPLLKTQIANLLIANKHQEALDLMMQHPRVTSIFNDSDGKSLYDYAKESDPDSLFIQFFEKNPTAMLMQYLIARKSEESLRYMLEHQISPFSEIHGKSIFQHALDLKTYGFVEQVINSTKKYEDKVKLRILQTKNTRGETYLAQLRKRKPIDQNAATARARYLSTLAQLDKYKPKPGSKRETMFNSFKELIKTFNDLSTYNEEAFIGLLLLNKKNIAAEYRIFSPNNWLFGSKFYDILENALKGLDLDLASLTPVEERKYYQALANVINTKPDFLANEYILQSLSKQAEVQLPKIASLVPKVEAKRLLTEKRFPHDPTIIPVSNGFYKINPEPIGQGYFGQVYVGQFYSLSEGNLTISRPLALKEMMPSQRDILDKEYAIIKKVYSLEQVERFEKNGKSYLTMPLFPGVQLDKYLDSHRELSLEERRLMAMDLLRDLNQLHQKEIVHNDLKPNNMLYDPIKKKMHIIDFGLAKNYEAREFMQFHSIDTALFGFEMPPEYLTGSQASTSMDIYSLTVTLAEILGINKRDLVNARLDKALVSLPHNLAYDIRAAYAKSNTLGDSLFDPIICRYHRTQAFEQFVTSYVHTPYDFSPYQDLLGAETIELLNQMQSVNPAERPSAETCLSVLNEQILQETSLPADKRLR